ncbi:MAG: hypothetical protein QMD11_08815 [Smithella sp.]|nr:hypothetical protein [Smithella sp.]
MTLLAITGAALILASLATGWLIIAEKYLSPAILKRLIRDDKHLVRAHVDYVIMGILLLMVFAMGIHLPSTVIVLACAGAIANPSLFIFLSLKPDVNKQIGSAFSLISTLTFLATTIGIGGASLLIIAELMK